ncbi:hypothetical protein P3X46_000907 [Hevea brasiliensis]|uniref:Uncharacterized protein n=1 Tax=Hevea brasiliensis TaxID=3981 RepID=A0ABQ9NDZ4_HEVBR|nr:hypothetical protein P3X46_000907 [Hevea brasiliensis]
MAATGEQHLTQPLLFKEIIFLTIDQEESLPIDIRSTWMTILENGTLPNDPLEAKRIVQKAFGYSVLDGWLYQRSFLRPWFRCITPEEGMVILINVHKGLCNSHKGGQTIGKNAFQ